MYFCMRDKYKQLRVFKLKFDCGEFDMVIHNPERETSRLFDIKHVIERDDPQLRHLLSPDKFGYAERKILSRAALYRSPDQDSSYVARYRNVCDYLNSLASGLASCCQGGSQEECGF